MRGRTPASVTVAGFLPELAARETLIQSQADIYAGLGKWADAAQVYEKAIADGSKSNRMQYEFARARMRNNPNDTKAIEVLKTLASSKEQDFWTELARKSIAGLTAKEGN
ncbi:MAG: hypothetical protein EOP09_10345 [Proteobacteria bacterium]|nr:MAG: hypothetical protein EOP09_10345 [Pseudomonadota bacterium]